MKMFSGKLSQQRWLIWTLVFLAASSASLILYVWYVSESDLLLDAGVFVPHHRVYLKASISEVKKGVEGLWVWAGPATGSEPKQSRVNVTMTLTISDHNHLLGKYGVTDSSGNFVDGCGIDSKDLACLHGAVSGGVRAKVVFLSERSKSFGQAVATYNAADDTLHWQITEKPAGEYGMPDDAVLKRK